MRAQWVCSRERRIALYKRSPINQKGFYKEACWEWDQVHKTWQMHCWLFLRQIRQWTSWTSFLLSLLLVQPVLLAEWARVVELSYSVWGTVSFLLSLTIVTGSSPLFILLSAIVFETSRYIVNDLVNVFRVYALVKSCVWMEWVLHMMSSIVWLLKGLKG